MPRDSKPRKLVKELLDPRIFCPVCDEDADNCSTRHENDIARVALDCAQAYLRATRATAMPDADFDGYQAMERIITDFAAPLYEQKEELVRVLRKSADRLTSAAVLLEFGGSADEMADVANRCRAAASEAERLLAEIRGGANEKRG